MPEPAWRELNRARWDESVAIHRAVPDYDVERIRAGTARLYAIEEAELAPVAGLRVLHLQCHFGYDTLILASRGADATGLDFSEAGVAAARENAAALGIDARFVLSDLYAAREAIPEPASFDLVYVSWGAICWLPDIAEWARTVAWFLRPGGRFYLAEGHPAAWVFDDATHGADGKPGWLAPYFGGEPIMMDDPRDYADAEARLRNTRTVTWIHPLSTMLAALTDAGLRLDWLHEHPRVPWRMFDQLVQDSDGLWTWPDRQWLPLALSLAMTRAG